MIKQRFYLEYGKLIMDVDRLKKALLSSHLLLDSRSSR